MTDSVAALDRVFLRLASTSAEKLPNILDKLLPILLGQLRTPSGPVFLKTLEIIKHVNTRVREDASVQLPCAALVTLIAKPATPSFVRGLALMYLDMGLPRLSPSARVALLPDLMMFVSLVTEAQIPQVTNAILCALSDYNKLELETELAIRKKSFEKLLADDKALTKLLEIFLDVILLRGGETVANPPPGLSSKRITQFLMTGKSAIAPSLETGNNHVHVLQLLRTGIFPQEFILPHFICASLANRHDAVDIAENALKRLHQVNYNNPRLVDALFGLLLGSPAQGRSATLPRTQVKILSHLARSDAAMERTQECLKIIFTLLFQEQPSTATHTATTIAALKIATLDFANAFAIRATLNTQTGRLLLTAFQTVLKPMQERHERTQRRRDAVAGGVDELLHSDGSGGNENDDDTESEMEQRDRAYSGIGHLARKQGELFNADTAVPRVLLQCLSSEVGQNKAGVQSALGLIADAFAAESTPKVVLAHVLEMVMDHAGSSDYQSRVFAVEWARRLFPFENCASRFVGLVLSQDGTLAVRQAALRALMPAVFASTSGTDGLVFETTQSLQTQAPSNVNTAWVDSREADYHSLSQPKHANLFPRARDWLNYLRDNVTFLTTTHGAGVGYELGYGPGTGTDSMKVDAPPPRKQAKRETLPVFVVGPSAQAAVFGFSSACIRAEVQRHVSASAEVGVSAANGEGIMDASTLVKTLKEDGLLDWYVGVLEHALEMGEMEPGVRVLYHVALRCLVQLVSASPAPFASSFMAKPNWLLRWTSSDQESCRRVSSELSPFIPTWHPAQQQNGSGISTVTQELLDAWLKRLALAPGTSAASRHGAVLSLGHLCGALVPVADVNTSILPTVAQVTRELAKALLSPQCAFVIERAAIEALGEIGECRPLALDVGTLPEPATTPAVVAAVVDANLDQPTRAQILLRMASVIKRGSGTKAGSSNISGLTNKSGAMGMGVAAEAAVHDGQMNELIEVTLDSCAKLMVGEGSAELRLFGLSTLFLVGRCKYDEVQFVMGEALVKVAKGAWLSSTQAEKPLQNSEISDKCSLETNPLSHILQELVKDQLNSTSNRHRASVAVWLVCIVQAFATSDVSFPFLVKIQEAFGRLLAEKGELTQECAAKGLAAVYERCSDEAVRKLLCSALVRLLTVGVRDYGALQAEAKPKKEKKIGSDDEAEEDDASDSEVEENDVSTTDDAASASTEKKKKKKKKKDKALPLRPANRTYKEMCDMAGVCGKQSLVYIFLALSTHHGIWSTERGVSFELASFVNPVNLRAQLEPHKEKLLPYLFRSRFDHNPAIRSAMTKLWTILVKDTEKSVVDENFHGLVKVMSQAIGSAKYRERHSGALALVDLLRGRPGRDLVPHLKPLWERTLRIYDDANDLVRAASIVLMSRLVRVSIRLCSVEQETDESVLREAIGVLIPVLLEKGIVNVAQDARGVSMYTLVEIVKASGQFLRPHIPAVLEMLLQSFWSFEDGSIERAGNFTKDRGGFLDITTEQLEQARVDAARDSIMSEAINSCLLQIRKDPPEVLHDICARVAHLLRRGVGLPTLSATAKAVYSLVDNKHLAGEEEGDSHALMPHSSKLLKALASGMISFQSVTLQRTYASSAARLARVAKPSAIHDYVDALVQWYAKVCTGGGEGNPEARLSVGFAVQELLDVLPPGEVTNVARAKLLPLILLARFDDDEANQTLWYGVLQSNFGSVERASRQYLDRVVEYMVESLTSTQWLVKRQALLALNEVVGGVGAELGREHATQLTKTLKEALPGRLWDGKHNALTVLVSLQRTGAMGTSESSSDGITDLLGVMMGECDRSDVVYAQVACAQLAATAQLIDATDESFDKQLGDAVLKCIEIAEKEMKRASSAKASSSTKLGAGSISTAIGKGGIGDSSPADKLLASALSGIGLCFPHGKLDRSLIEVALDTIGNALTGTAWQVQVAAVNALKQVMGRVTKAKAVASKLDEWMAVSVLTLLHDSLEKSTKPAVLMSASGATEKAAQEGWFAVQNSSGTNKEEKEAGVAREKLLVRLRGMLKHRDGQVAAAAARALRETAK